MLARTANGKDIYSSYETAAHMRVHAEVDLRNILEAIKKIDDYEGPKQMCQIDLGRTIGKDNCVEVQPGDNPKMMYRREREGQTPVLVYGKAADTSLINIGICLDDDGKHTMFTSFYGQLAPKEPWDKSLKPEEIQESREFWSKHALVVTRYDIDWERTDLEYEINQGSVAKINSLCMDTQDQISALRGNPEPEKEDYEAFLSGRQYALHYISDSLEMGAHVTEINNKDSSVMIKGDDLSGFIGWMADTFDETTISAHAFPGGLNHTYMEMYIEGINSAFDEATEITGIDLRDFTMNHDLMRSEHEQIDAPVEEAEL